MPDIFGTWFIQVILDDSKKWIVQIMSLGIQRPLLRAKGGAHTHGDPIVMVRK